MPTAPTPPSLPVLSLEQWVVHAGRSRWQVVALAAGWGLSKRQLERHFAQNYGRTPQRWVREQRLLLARAWLLAGHPVKAVADRLDFRTIAHFCHWFKKGTGLTPSGFRRLTVLPAPPLAPAPLAAECRV